MEETYAKLHKICVGTIGDVKEKILVDVPLTNDFFFPLCRANDNHINKNGYEVFNKEILKTEKWEDNQLIYGKLHFYYDGNGKYQRSFIIENLNATNQYKEEYV